MDGKKKNSGKLSEFIRTHKRLSIIIASAFLVVCASVAVLIFVISGNLPPNRPSNSDNPITKGETSVAYYYGLPGGEVVLTFDSDWRFTLVGPELNKSGSYEVDGKNLTLDFVRLKDGTASATLGENKMAVVLDGATCTFRKKINFSVTFETNGGSEVPNVSVMNGKTVSEPAAPTKENCDFVGWYADEALTIPYNFGGAIIVSDTVIYAKWADKI